MALPVILIDSATGSDTQASGAGPSTALFGTTDASTDGAGTTVTLTAGTDLTNVATDGSHVIYLADTTAGARNFGKITAKAGSGGATPNVTVSNAFGLSLSGKSWAIGGKRASIGGTNSAKLISNNSAAGDAMPGWAIEMSSGHSETIAATVTWRRNGDITDGQIILRGVSGAATLPLLTFSNNGVAFTIDSRSYLRFENFELRNSHATKTASYAFSHGNASGVGTVITKIKIAHSSNKFYRGIQIAAPSNQPSHRVTQCEIGYCADIGLSLAGGTMYSEFSENFIHDCTSHGIAVSAANCGGRIDRNLIYANGGDGINLGMTVSAANVLSVSHNTIDANSGDGIECTASTTAVMSLAKIRNNLITNNGGYVLRFSGASISDLILEAQGVEITGTCHYNNSLGFSNLSLNFATNTSNVNPSYTSAAGGNFAVAAGVATLGSPSGGSQVIGYSSTYSYVDPGAAQRQEAGGSGGLIGGGRMDGGMQ